MGKKSCSGMDATMIQSVCVGEHVILDLTLTCDPALAGKRGDAS
jgi:hypothetical protein